MYSSFTAPQQRCHQKTLLKARIGPAGKGGCHRSAHLHRNICILAFILATRQLTIVCLHYPLTLKWRSLDTWHKQQHPPCVRMLNVCFLSHVWRNLNRHQLESPGKPTGQARRVPPLTQMEILSNTAIFYAVRAFTQPISYLPQNSDFSCVLQPWTSYRIFESPPHSSFCACTRCTRVI